MYMQGQMAIHMDECLNPKCDCNQLVNKFDVVTKQLEQEVNLQQMERSHTLFKMR